MKLTWSKLRSIPFLAIFIAWPLASFADNMVVNGSFEEPAYGVPGIYQDDPGTGWTKGWFAPIALVNGNVKDESGQRFGATPFGVQYIGLDAESHGFYPNENQTIDGFVAGQRYVFTFYAADSAGGPDPALEVLIQGVYGHTFVDTVVQLPVAGPYFKKIKFQKIVRTFKAPASGAATLTLKNVGGASLSIDNVSLEAVAN